LRKIRVNDDDNKLLKKSKQVFYSGRLLLRKLCKNLLIDDCSENEGSRSKGDSGSGNEGGGTGEGFTSAASGGD